MKNKIPKSKVIEYLVIITVFILGIFIRIQYFDQTSKDITAYTRAITELKSGINPYKWTLESYSNENDPGNHGYAYLPGILYLVTALNYIADLINVPFKYLWKIPVLLSDIGIGIFILKKLKKRDLLSKTLALSMWFFNPYAYFRGGYTYFDPITIMFMLISLHYLEKDSYKSGFFYALSISCKVFPYIIFPVYIVKLLPKTIEQIKNKEKNCDLFKFLLASITVAILISLPFTKSVQDFITYTKGAVFVHSERFIQGRPFLFYISYYMKIELFQIIPFKVYTLLASFSGWVIIFILYGMGKKMDKYTMSVIPFLTFYLFTPVLNRTYLTWFIPLFVIGTSKTIRSKYLFFIINIAFYAFYSWYLLQWEDGFHIWHP